MSDGDVLARFKQAQREAWSKFAPLESVTTPSAAWLVNFAGVKSGQSVLDVACGTGVVALTAARRGAHVTGIDLTPELLARARENAAIANFAIDWHEADAEALPFREASYDIVLSQFGHMFAPRPHVVIAEMLRVLRPGGTIAFTTWPPELLVGGSFALTAKYMPPPPPGVSRPPLWGDVNLVRERLGDAVEQIQFDRHRNLFPALSVQHYRHHVEKTAGTIMKLVESLSASDPGRLAQFRAEHEAMVQPFFGDNIVRQDYLMTRARKR
ncbi:MAG: class I SAM-dependent methyltransferase [Chthoniobacterales bacterium]|nr:class I SAM-dependent methyltransferase [Chthoniobacterales bacterium]